MARSASRYAARFLASVCVVGLAAPLAAQDAPVEEDQPAAVENRNEILVTGLRRADTLQDTPAAITAFDSEEIESARIVRPADFVELTPNVTLVETQNAGNAFIVIRGITQARNSEPSVAVVVTACSR